jgi:hypothetical protein
LGAIQTYIQLQIDGSAARRRLLKRGPATAFLKASRTLRAGVVQETLADVLPDRLGAGQPDSICLLDLDGPAAAGAPHPQNMLGNFGQPQRPDRSTRLHGTGVGERVA